MKLFLFSILLFSIPMLCVAQDDEDAVKGFEVKKKKVAIDFENSNVYDDEITFIVFDRAKMEEFDSNYPNLSYTDAKVKNAIRQLTLTKYTDFKLPVKEELFATKCTDKPEAKDFEIAQVVLNSALDSNSKFIKNNFGGAVNFLYFYNCLPDIIQAKWYQELTGNYKINANMMAFLREESFLFDQLITGVKQKDLSEVDMIFGGHNFNEIEKTEALNIKQVLINSKELKDNSMLESKKIMFELISKIMTGEWRVFIVEWE